MNNDVFSDLTGISTGPKPMRANKALGLKQQKNVLDLLAPQTNGAQSRAQAPYTPAPVHDLSDLEQLPSSTNTPEPSTDAFDLFSDLALPSGSGAAEPVTIQLQEEPQAPALPELVQVEQPLPAKKPSKSESPRRAAKPQPAPVVVHPPEDVCPPPPAYSELISGGLGPSPPPLSSLSPAGSNDSLSSPRGRAPTVFIHVDDDPTRFPYHEPPPLPKPTPRSIPRNNTARRTSSQSSTSGARGSPTAASLAKRKPSSNGRSPPKRSFSSGRSPTHVASANATQMPSLLDVANDGPVATAGAAAAGAASTPGMPPPAYNDLFTPPTRTYTGTSTITSASSNAQSVLPPTADLLSDFGTPGDLLSTPDATHTDAAVSVSPRRVAPVATARHDASGAQPSIAATATADLLGGSFANLPEPSADLLGAEDFASAASPQRVDAAAAAIDDVFGFESTGSGTSPAVATGGAAGAPMAQVGDGFDDDFFSGGAAAAPSQLGASAGGGESDADWLTHLGGAGAPNTSSAKAVRSSSRASAAPQQAAGVQESGDVLLQQAIANAQQACMSLSQERALRLQGAIAQAHQYVAEKVEEKQLQAGHVTEDGLRFATLGASKTAASILTKTVEHHQHESQQEANVEEAFEYRDSIKADIKAWAFQGGTRRGLRNLLTSLDKVLWEGATWKCTSLADVSTDAQVKKVLNKARLLLHTDKMARQPEKIRLRAELILIEIDKALKGVA